MTAKSRRLRGLKLLENWGLPVPRWQKIMDKDDLRELNLRDSEFGWTIRTCLSNGSRETGGFYLNYGSSDEIISLLEERLHKFSPPEFYLVYPSWNFTFSVNVVL